MKQHMEQVIKDAKERDEARMREIKQLRERSKMELQELTEKSNSSSKDSLTLFRDAEALRQRLLGEASNELQDLRSEFSQQKEVLSEMLREASAETSQLRQSLEISESEAASSLEATRESLAEAQQSQGRLRSELRSQQERSKRAERELEQTHAECQDAILLLSSASVRDSRVEVAQALLESRVQNLQETGRGRQERHGCEQLEGLRAEAEAARAAEEEQRNQAQAAEARYQECEEQLKAKSQDFRPVRMCLEGVLVWLCEQKQDFELQLHNLQEDLKSAQKSGSLEAEHRESVSAAQQKMKEAQQEVQVALAERQAAEEQAQKALRRAEAAEEELARLKADALNFHEAEKELREKAQEAQSSCDSHKQLIRALQQSMAEQKQEVDQELESLRKQLAETTPVRTLSGSSRTLLREEADLPEDQDPEIKEEDEEVSKASKEPEKMELEVEGDAEASSLLDQLDSLASTPGVRAKNSAVPEAAGHEEVAQLWDRINYLERRCRTLQKKLDARPIIYQAPTGYGPLNLEAGGEVIGRVSWEPWLQEVTGSVARRLHLPQGSEHRVASVAAPLCQAIEVPLRNFTQRLLRRDRWFWVFYVHLLLLYAIAASCIARSSNPVSPAECVDARLHQLQAAEGLSLRATETRALVDDKARGDAMSLPRVIGSSPLARQIDFSDAWKASTHSRFCCLIYATQNGWKLPILFEEMQSPYDWCLVDFEKNEQKSEAFLKINPNGRIPALIDRQAGLVISQGELESVQLFEDTNLQRHLQCKQWLYWQVSGQGPMLGQSMYFNRIAATKGQRDDFAIARFGNEAQRCLKMLDEQLLQTGVAFRLHRVFQGTAAAEGGVRPGDMLLAINGAETFGRAREDGTIILEAVKEDSAKQQGDPRVLFHSEEEEKLPSNTSKKTLTSSWEPGRSPKRGRSPQAEKGSEGTQTYLGLRRFITARKDSTPSVKMFQFFVLIHHFDACRGGDHVLCPLAGCPVVPARPRDPP
eukprot:g18697.t1